MHCNTQITKKKEKKKEIVFPLTINYKIIAGHIYL